ncbi:J domain-containing protein required for chloroplast accumulation response 1 isoform X3 [Vicia villosa]|uniref:J domain-containing protein required for chloroplast accumulation response 1 isoform X3 n=1 Tax=Vicia villosa TaxID=3911 RepID=UPI00273CF4AA|nr:J domain-containing protein required for chloroplast accumulation response 1 isoform X3 [Vicia villosa]
MERFYNSSEQRDDDSYSNPSTSQRELEVDFNDVFGGPPRRSSGFSGEEGESGCCKWPMEGERGKSVFGDDSGVRRRYTNKKAKDFFDDIFGGEESQSQSQSPSGCSTPKKRDLQPLASSLPPSFSLPATSTKGIFGSPPSSRNPLDNNIAASNGLVFSDSNLSRFSAQHKESRKDLKPSNRQSLLSKEFSNSGLSDKVDKGNIMKQDTSVTEVSPDDNDNTSNEKFHFSIYKWASKGVTLAMPIRSERISRSKNKFKLEKCSSAKDWIVTEITTQNDSPIVYNDSSLTRNEKQDVSKTTTTIQNKVDSDQTVKHRVSGKDSIDSLSSRETLIKDVLVSPVTKESKAESNTLSTSEIVFYGKIEAANETQKHDSKSLNSLFGKSNKKQDDDAITRKAKEGNKGKSSKKLSSNLDIPINPKQDDGEITRKTREENTAKSSKKLSSNVDIPINPKEQVLTGDGEITRKAREGNTAKISKKLSSNFDIHVNPKKQDEKRKTVPMRGVEYSKVTSEALLSPGRRSMGKGRVKGKVKDFVQIFNQDAETKPKADSKSRLQGYAYKQKGAVRANNDVDGEAEKSRKEISNIEITDMPANSFSQQDDISASEIHDISFAEDIGDKDESFHENFTIQVLSEDEGEVAQNQEIQEIQVIDKKIQQWSKGKEGNIRSLLSTLQYVLWPNCGWKPVPLVDIIEGNAVKRSYQRALLSLHPDKLQQKGATSEQKYIAEKVFDILQEAWTQFNMVGPL